MPAGPIVAPRTVVASRKDVFSFLSDLRNHWILADRFVEVVSIDNGAEDRSRGGKVRLCGPLGLRRTVTTEVTTLDPPDLIGGSASLGATVARVSWRLAAAGDGTNVVLEAEVDNMGRVDSLLLALGGRAWLHRRFESVLKTLSERIAK